MRFTNKVALVTGAGSGIGLATAHRLADEGATVVAAVLDEAQREEVSGFDVVMLDVRSEAMWDRVIAHLEGTYNGLDILVNNAGVNRRGTAENTSYELWGTSKNSSFSGVVDLESG